MQLKLKLESVTMMLQSMDEKYIYITLKWRSCVTPPLFFLVGQVEMNYDSKHLHRKI